MPRAIRTPEEIFRQEKKDLYFVEFLFAGKSAAIVDDHPELFQFGVFGPVDDPPGRSQLLPWFQESLPTVPIEPLAPSERSGMLEGGIDGRIRIDFDPRSLAVYQAHWEDEDGKSKDPRWQCYVWRYGEWLENHDASDEP